MGCCRGFRFRLLGGEISRGWPAGLFCCTSDAYPQARCDQLWPLALGGLIVVFRLGLRAQRRLHGTDVSLRSNCGQPDDSGSPARSGGELRCRRAHCKQAASGGPGIAEVEFRFTRAIATGSKSRKPEQCDPRKTNGIEFRTEPRRRVARYICGTDENYEMLVICRLIFRGICDQVARLQLRQDVVLCEWQTPRLELRSNYRSELRRNKVRHHLWDRISTICTSILDVECRL